MLRVIDLSCVCSLTHTSQEDDRQIGDYAVIASDNGQNRRRLLR